MTESMREALDALSYLRSIACQHEDSTDIAPEIAEAYEAIKKALSQHQQWIKCSDRFPEINKQVLTYCVEYPSDGFELEERIGDDDWSMNYSASHWMELPEPPKE